MDNGGKKKKKNATKSEPSLLVTLKSSLTRGAGNAAPSTLLFAEEVLICPFTTLGIGSHLQVEIHHLLVHKKKNAWPIGTFQVMDFLASFIAGFDKSVIHTKTLSFKLMVNIYNIITQ